MLLVYRMDTLEKGPSVDIMLWCFQYPSKNSWGN
jgi:hypothetical protein